MRRIFPPLYWSIRLPTLLALFWRKHPGQPNGSGMERKGPLSFIIFRLDAMGDVVMTTPLFRALKTAHPRSRITVVVQPVYKSLLATNPDIDELLTLPTLRPAWLPQRMRRLLAATLFYWSKLRKRHFDCAISPRWDSDEHLATFLCVSCNAGTRVGYSEAATAAKQSINRGFDGAYTLCLPPGPVRHEIRRNLAIAEALGARHYDLHTEVHLTERDRKHAAELLRPVPPGAKIIAIGFGAQSPGRQWPLERYAETIERLGQHYRVSPVIVCSASELGNAQTIARLLPHPPMIVSGAPLRDVCAVLERCALFIGNDSGCAHLAAAMGCRTIVISRHPRSGDPNHYNSPIRFAPQGQQVRVLQPEAGLDGCTRGCVEREPHCIKQISVLEVVAAGCGMLSQGMPFMIPAEGGQRFSLAKPFSQNGTGGTYIRNEGHLALAHTEGRDW
jgi:ADP-heptose:LPS heptosyltransferase